MERRGLFYLNDADFIESSEIAPAIDAALFLYCSTIILSIPRDLRDRRAGSYIN